MPVCGLSEITTGHPESAGKICIFKKSSVAQHKMWNFKFIDFCFVFGFVYIVLYSSMYYNIDSSNMCFYFR